MTTDHDAAIRSDAHAMSDARALPGGPALRVAVLVGAITMFAGAAEPTLRPLVPVGAAIQLGAVVLLWRRGGVSTAEVLAGAILLRVMAMAVPVGLSDDVYRYLWDGLIQLEGFDPFAARPADLDAMRARHPELFARLNSPDYYSVYPPVSQIVFAGAAWLGERGLPAVAVLRSLFAAAEMMGVWLLTRAAPARTVLLYAWQPLVVLEVAAGLHTEALVVPLLVAAFLAERRGREGVLGAALAMAAWVKLYPLLLVPALALRRRWTALAVFAGASVLLWLPYAHSPANMLTSLGLYARVFEFNGGLYHLLSEPLAWLIGYNPIRQLGPLLQGAALIVIILIYARAYRREWSLVRLWIWTFGTVLVFATTVHPWYLVPLLAALPLARGSGWAWQAWSVGALGTYLYYTHGVYAPMVTFAWGAWLAAALWTRRDALLQHVQRRRARGKADRLVPHLPPETMRLLDVGAAEGYVGDGLGTRLGAAVTLVDVVDMNRTARALVLADGACLPFESRRFDAVLLVFVLHHTADPEGVLGEALRVARGRVLIVESVVTGPRQHRLLRTIDRLANRLRSSGAMRAQESHLHFQRREAWRTLIGRVGGHVVHEQAWGGPVHPQVLYVVEAAASSTASA